MTISWQPSFTRKDLEIVTEKTIYDGPVKLLERQLRFRMFAGNWSPVIRRTCINRGGSAAVLLYEPEQDVVIMVEQFRAGLICDDGVVSDSPWILEPVAGMLDSDTAETTAYKEAREEAGCEILELIPIGKYLVSPGISNESTAVFCGRIRHYVAGSVHGLPEENENIKVHVLPVADAFRILTSGKALAAGTMICLQWLQINHIELRREMLTH